VTDEDTGLDGAMAASGVTIVLETTGRRSGLPRRVHVGFVEEPDGRLLVAAAGDGAAWARNLSAHPACHVERLGVRRAFRAEPLSDADHHAAVASLILKYGTPSERLGAGPAFRLSPLAGQ
jgi:deazaflavin-dependent oxidoreductase (nitroreductase family)